MAQDFRVGGWRVGGPGRVQAEIEGHEALRKPTKPSRSKAKSPGFRVQGLGPITTTLRESHCCQTPPSFSTSGRAHLRSRPRGFAPPGRCNFGLSKDCVSFFYQGFNQGCFMDAGVSGSTSHGLPAQGCRNPKLCT